MASKLRVVSPGEKSSQRKALTITTAATDGDRLDLLMAMRLRVATAVEDPNTPARDLAALTRRLMEIAKDIDVLRAAADYEEGHAGNVDDDTFDASAV